MFGGSAWVVVVRGEVARKLRVIRMLMLMTMMMMMMMMVVMIVTKVGTYPSETQISTPGDVYSHSEMREGEGASERDLK
jgi:hypothetical protein